MYTRIQRAQKSLRGISIGDAFGESFFGDTDQILAYIAKREIPPSSWEFTDDTVMAIAVFEQLEKNGAIKQDELARQFVANHDKDPNRGYGATARRILREIDDGADWRVVASSVFEGMGSMGNGASMRVGPIGAYFFDDKAAIKEACIQSAEITHTHLEGITGAIAVGLATGIATRLKINQTTVSPDEFMAEIVAELPDSDTKHKINKARSIPYDFNIETVKSILGNGSKITAQDTVPFSIWCAANNLGNFEASLWKAVSILGDRDTICAIIGGITIMSSDEQTVPENWLSAVEKFEKSVFRCRF